MTGFRLFASLSLEANIFIKSIITRNKSRQSLLRAFHVGAWEHQLAEEDENIKIATYRRIGREAKLDLDDFLVKPQTQEEIDNIFKEIAGGDGEVEKRLQLLSYEIMIKREEEGLIPNRIKKDQWEELLRLNSLHSRKRYLTFLHKTEKKRESQRIKEALRKRDGAMSENLFKNCPHIYYGLGGYAMLQRVYPTTLAPLLDIKILTNKLFAPPIVFDCSYQDYMNEFKSKYCAKQIALSFLVNKTHPHPCTLQLFNVQKDGLLMQQLKACKQTLQEDENHHEIYENSYLDVYPKDRLVYLTPHTKYYLNEPRSDDIYIIGAFVDKGDGAQISLAKAKEQGLRMAKLPLEKYLLWRKGTKSLTLNNVTNILLDLRYYGNWEKALQSIPTRNLND